MQLFVEHILQSWRNAAYRGSLIDSWGTARTCEMGGAEVMALRQVEAVMTETGNEEHGHRGQECIASYAL